MMELTKKEMLEVARELMNMKREWNQSPEKENLSFLIQQIYLAIGDELESAAYYKDLAEIAPDQFTADMFMDFSDNDRSHAYQLQQAYERLTGRDYMPARELEFKFELTEDDYIEALKSRILEETENMQDYKSYYLMTSNPYLRDIFFNSMNDDAYHAMRLLYLLQIAMG